MKTITSLLILFFALPAAAYVSSSTNYRIQADSLNLAGTSSNSASYRLEETVGETGTGLATSTNYTLSAGYQAMLASSISISVPADASLPAIDTKAGGQGSGSLVWTVTTDNAAGYTLAVKASTNPALQAGSNSFLDYTPSGAVPDYRWSVAGSAAKFGFSPEGTDIDSRYRDNGSACGVGASNSSSTCWEGFSTTNRQVASASSANQPSGTAPPIKFLAEIGASATQAAGNYAATITATALAQ